MSSVGPCGLPSSLTRCSTSSTLTDSSSTPWPRTTALTSNGSSGNTRGLAYTSVTARLRGLSGSPTPTISSGTRSSSGLSFWRGQVEQIIAAHVLAGMLAVGEQHRPGPYGR